MYKIQIHSEHQLALAILVSAAVAYVGFLCITIDSSFCDVQILAVVVDERLAIIPLVYSTIFWISCHVTGSTLCCNIIQVTVIVHLQ